MHQISADELKSPLRAVAVVRTSLDALARAAGIRPETHTGNLGKQREAMLEADDGSQYMLVEFCEGPTHDVEVRAEERIADPDSAIDRFLETLELPPDLIVWRVSKGDWQPDEDAASGEPSGTGVASQPSPRDGPQVGEQSQRTGDRDQMADVLLLIDKLDDLIHHAKRVPLTDQMRVDKEEIYDVLDQMRATIPEEIKQTRWIVKERHEMLAEAKRETERIVKEARERHDQLLSEEEITRHAAQAAEEIIADARAREREIRLGAEDYADEILNTLEVNLSKFIAAVRRGRDRLAGEYESADVTASRTPEGGSGGPVQRTARRSLAR